MRQPSQDSERKSTSHHESILSRVAFNRHRSSGHPEIRRFDTLCPVVIEHCESLLDIRPSRQSIKSTANINEQPSIITINVGGNRFQTYLSTLQLYPETLLGNEHKRKQYWNPEIREYFFDRHRACFESILYYYQSNGRLRRPELVPLDTFLEEISFFQLGPDAIAQIHKTENIRVVKHIAMPRMLWRRYIWFYFEFPQHSSLARVINIASLFFTIFSCISLAIETLPTYQEDNLCNDQDNNSSNTTSISQCPTTFTSPFFIIQTICVIYFTIEFFLRLISTPSYFRFFISLYNWIDLGSIVPYFIFLSLELSNQNHQLSTNAILGIRLFRVLRFARIFKIYLVFRKLKTLRVLSATIKESLMDFAVMIMILALIAFLFGAVTFFAEHGGNIDVFDSIPKATYWAIITIIGVGYGDTYPVTVIGRILACFCGLVRASMMGMLVSVLGDRYQRVYNRKMYLPEPEESAVELNPRSASQDETKSISLSLQIPHRIREFSAAVSHRLSTVSRRFKHDRRRSSSQPYKVQFVVSLDGENIDHNEANNIAMVMREKIAETVSNTCTDISLKTVEEKTNLPWTTDASNSLYNSNSNFVTKTANDESMQRWKSQNF